MFSKSLCSEHMLFYSNAILLRKKSWFVGLSHYTQVEIAMGEKECNYLDSSIANASNAKMLWLFAECNLQPKY